MCGMYCIWYVSQIINIESKLVNVNQMVKCLNPALQKNTGLCPESEDTGVTFTFIFTLFTTPQQLVSAHSVCLL